MNKKCIIQGEEVMTLLILNGLQYCVVTYTLTDILYLQFRVPLSQSSSISFIPISCLLHNGVNPYIVAHYIGIVILLMLDWVH